VYAITNPSGFGIATGNEADGDEDFLTKSCFFSPLERLGNPRGQRVHPGVRYSQTLQMPKRPLAFVVSIAVLCSQSRRRDSLSQKSTRAGSTHIAVWKYTGREQAVYSLLQKCQSLV
jgi:hypothetical protein